ncbi:MAG: PorT family protein [Cyclobacteriaceae bacterium]
MPRFFGRILLIVACSTASYGAWAQGSFYVGPVAGGQGSSAYLAHTRVYRFRLLEEVVSGYHFGGVARYFNAYRDGIINSGIQVGGIYHQRGWKQFYLQIDSTDASNPLITGGTALTRLNYFTVPVEAILYLGSEKNKIYASAGLYLDFLVSARHAGDQPDPDLDFHEVDYFTYEEGRDPTFGYGFKGSLGYQRDIGPGAVMAEAYFSYGFSNLLVTENRAIEFPDISNHWAVGGRVGYLIKFGGRKPIILEGESD